LAFGVGLARQLEIPGENLEGVADAIKFIYDLRTNDLAQINVGNKVVVIGMGMTAIDAATQAKRLGAADVTLVYRRTQDEMPCTEKDLNIVQTRWLRPNLVSFSKRNFRQKRESYPYCFRQNETG